MAFVHACHRRRLAIFAAAAITTLAIDGRAQDPAPFDLILDNGRIVDGTGSPWFVADVGIRGDRIAAIGRLDDASAARRIDASDRVVAPGFIDPHVHGDVFGRNSVALNFLIQGVTTLVSGNDGSSPFPIGETMRRLEAAEFAPNYALYVGHGTIRRRVMGTEDRAPTVEELESMRRLVAEGMRDGALGLSTGLTYVPGAYATTEEAIELAKVAARHGGVYISHMRDEMRGVLDSVRETIRIGEEARIPVQMTHHKIGGSGQFGQSADSIRLMTEARARGVDVTFDQYPYTASATGLTVLFPTWAMAEGGLNERLMDPPTRARIKADMKPFLDDRMGDDPSRIQFSQLRMDPEMAGKRLSDLLAKHNKPLNQDAAAEMLIEIVLNGGGSGIYHSYSEEDMQALLRSPFGMVGSDGAITAPGRGFTHPRAYGAFARVLGRYVRELGVISLEAAIRKMTSFPAARLNLKDRGLIREGMAADIVVFDPATIADRSDFMDPHQYAVGVEVVVVNGVVAIEEGEYNEAKPGRALHGPGRAR